MPEYHLETIPSQEKLRAEARRTPYFMRPTQVPTAAISEAFLTDEQCDAIVARYDSEEPYRFGGCEAITRECPRPLDDILEPLERCARTLNELFWGFDLDAEPAAWMQTYEKGMQYALHTDAAPGQMRKLTAVAFLTDPSAYSGGTLRLRVEPRSYSTPKARGSVVVFPSWVPHFVEPIREGQRQTINLGFWGPNFR